MTNRSTTIIQEKKKKKGNLRNYVVMHQQSNIHGKKLMLCISRYPLVVAYYELRRPNETIIGVCYRKLIRILLALKEEHVHYYPKHDKIIFQHEFFSSCSSTSCITSQNLLRNTQLESPSPPTVFIRHSPFRLSLV
ncbi:hypothetical protein TNCV_4749081 [Trichonephila clavipes]|nr:hypothetical protein TNCV_4749081 [Trichonephila clavipes]